MLGTCDPKMLNTQPVPFEIHNLVRKQKCAESQSDVSDHHPIWGKWVELVTRDDCPAEQSLGDAGRTGAGGWQAGICESSSWSCPGEHTGDGRPSGVPLGVRWEIQCRTNTHKGTTGHLFSGTL